MLLFRCNTFEEFETLEECLVQCRHLFELGCRDNFTSATEELRQLSLNSVYYGCVQVALFSFRSSLTVEKVDQFSKNNLPSDFASIMWMKLLLRLISLLNCAMSS